MLMKRLGFSKGATPFFTLVSTNDRWHTEKHDSFISPCQDGTVIMEFSGKELVKENQMLLLFPSGGLRATF